MSFDLYANTAIAPKAVEPCITTLDALAAAEWTQLADGRWQLQWQDHTDYGDDGCIDDNDGHFTCILDSDGPANWTYDYDHSHRGGPQERNYLGCDGYVEDAKAMVRKEMERMVKDWTFGIEDQRRLDEEVDGEEA